MSFGQIVAAVFVGNLAIVIVLGAGALLAAGRMKRKFSRRKK